MREIIVKVSYKRKIRKTRQHWIENAIGIIFYVYMFGLVKYSLTSRVLVLREKVKKKAVSLLCKNSNATPT